MPEARSVTVQNDVRLPRSRVYRPRPIRAIGRARGTSFGAPALSRSVDIRCASVFGCSEPLVRRILLSPRLPLKELPMVLLALSELGWGLFGRCEELQGDVVWVSERQARTIRRVDDTAVRDAK